MPELTRKPLSWFKMKPQVRRQFDEEGLRALGESLLVKQLQPVLAKSEGTLIAGERRYRAAALVGKPDLEVIITEELLTETEIRLIQLAENIHRAELSDGEKSRAFAELLSLNPAWQNRDLASHLKLKESTITKYLSPSRCVEEVRRALEAGTIGITSCYEISKAAPEEQEELLKVKLAGASRDGLVRHIRKQRNEASSQVRVTRMHCPMPSGVTVTICGRDLTLDDAIDVTGELLKLMRAASKENLDGKTFSAVCARKAKNPVEVTSDVEIQS